MNFYALSDKGMVRPNNEDFTESFQLRISRMDGTTESFTALLLADGMGGAAAGEYASSLAIKTAKQKLMAGLLSETPETLLGTDLRELLVQCCNEANEAIYRKAQENPEMEGMGTTVVLAIVSRDMLTLCHVGDSRCYMHREGRLKQLTRDHSLVQEMIDTGKITPDQAANHPNKNIITRALGVAPTVQADTSRLPIFTGDVLVLGSDGLFGFVNDRTVKDMVEKQAAQPNANLKQLAQHLIECANMNGGADNISVCLYRH
ncbi:MAG TPA: Stp1/IreP family PP2C-type Ser/Thr phosphatase [Candidatus Ozemobacteraceae bacterium]|nr:Stp1/IreP family PP2C-type Ser/Thr phosphatase [Candidatus Ozemobacteraceae bacterium]